MTQQNTPAGEYHDEDRCFAMDMNEQFPGVDWEGQCVEYERFMCGKADVKTRQRVMALLRNPASPLSFWLHHSEALMDRLLGRKIGERE